MRRVLLTLLLLQLALAAPASAAPDQWTRWAVPQNLGISATVRSLDFTAPGVVYAGTEDDGVFRSIGGPFAWEQNNDGLGAPGADNIRHVTSSNGILYAATSIGIFKKPANGQTWMPHGQGAEPGRLNLPVQYIHFEGGTMLAGVAAASPGVYRSTDGGEHWTRSAGIPTGTSIYYIHSTAGMLFAAADNGVYRSLDGGGSWHLRSDGLPFAFHYRMAGDAANLYVATTSGVYHSNNLGETWTERNGFGNGALLNTQTLGMLAAPSGFGGGRFLVSTGQGVWASINQGQTWGKMSSDSTPASPKFGDLKVWTLGFNIVSTPGFLIAGTQGWGAYTIPFQPVAPGNTAPNTNSPAPQPRVGNKLVGTPGSWNGTAPIFLSYMWMRCDNTNNNTIANDCDETGDTGLTHVVTSDDNGKYLRLRVTANGIVPPAPGNGTRYSAPSPIVAAAQGNPPVPPGGSYPRILGPDGQSSLSKSWPWGSEYTIDPGTWNPGSTTFEYVWLRCTGASAGTCTPIPGATGQKYKTVPADTDHGLRVEVTGTANNNSQTVYNGPTFQVTEVVPENTSAPLVVGDPWVGSTLDSSGGAWKGRNIKYFRSWQVCDADGTGCNTIPSETGPQYTINKIYLGKRLRVRIQVSNADGSQDDREAFSELTPVITNPPTDQPPGGGGDPPVVNPPVVNPPVVNPPVVNPPRPPRKPSLIVPRRLRVGAQLKAPAIPGATKLKYQWLRNGKKIKRASKRTYRVKKADRGKKLSCRISFVLGGQPLKVTTQSVKIPRKRR
jgi:hypothetical protein